MKFRFCGDGDCPDWVLAEIHSNICMLSSMKLRALTHCVVRGICNEEIVEDKVKEILTTSKLEISSAKSVISCLRFILISAARYYVEESIFDAELQQIGLPKEHTSIVCRVFSENLTNIRKTLLSSKLAVNKLDSMSCDYVSPFRDSIQVNIKITNEVFHNISMNTSYKVNCYNSTVGLLLKELRVIDKIMNNFDYKTKYCKKYD